MCEKEWVLILFVKKNGDGSDSFRECDKNHTTKIVCENAVGLIIKGL